MVSAKFIKLSIESMNGISVSSIKNSDRCRVVLCFSARKIGPKVNTLPIEQAAISACNCAETVRLAVFPEKSRHFLRS